MLASVALAWILSGAALAPSEETGGRTTPPAFAGLTSAVGSGFPFCAIRLDWAPATPACPNTTVTYSVYRSATPGFTPGPANLRASCVSSVRYYDRVNTVARFYYVVRAEDSQGNGSGACNNGNEDSNLQERNAAPGGPGTTVLDDVESGGAAWTTAGGTGGNPWTIATTASHSPTHAWFWPDPASVTLQPLTRIANFTFATAGGLLSWWHRVQTESTFDGYVLEYSLDNGTTWSDILLGQGPVPADPNRFLQNGYNATLSTGFQNPLPGRRAWSGTLGNPDFAEVVVNMNAFAGRDVKIRWRAGSDASVGATGIWIDDITLSTGGGCMPFPDPVAGPLPIALAVDAAGDGVYQPNETVTVAPTWRNYGISTVNLAGTLLDYFGPPGPTYTVVDGSARYGLIPVGASASCSSQNDCYAVANTAATRPATHWDTTALEMVTPGSAPGFWTLHVGDSFGDVPRTSPFHRFVETLLHRRITGAARRRRIAR